MAIGMHRPGIDGARHTRPRDTHLHRRWTHLSTSAHCREPEAAAAETAHRQPQRPRVQQLQVIDCRPWHAGVMVAMSDVQPRGRGFELTAIIHCNVVIVSSNNTPRGPGVPPFRLCSSLVHSLPHLLLFITFSLFPFLIHFTYFLLLSIRSLSTRIVLLRFQA